MVAPGRVESRGRIFETLDHPQRARRRGVRQALEKHGTKIKVSERSSMMTRKIQMMVLALALALSLAMAASAQEAAEKITIKRDTKLGTEVLPKGDYTLRFVDGDKGEVVFLQGKREVLKATYTVARLDKEAGSSAVVSSLGSDGSYLLKRIEFKGKNSAFVFENAVAKLISK
jgi:hypothetical protein